MFHTHDIILALWEELYMNKTYSMSIRVSEEELNKYKTGGKTRVVFLLIVSL